MTKDDMQIRKILLVYAQLRIGGIETLILKMCKWLSANGYYVTLFIYGGGGELSEDISRLKNVNLIVNKGLLKIDTKSRKIIDILLVGLKLPYYLIRYPGKEKYDLIFSFTPESFLVSYLFYGNVRLSGVYHSPLYSQVNQQPIISKIREIDASFNSKIVCPTPKIKKNTESILKKKTAGFIFPIPIDFDAKMHTKSGNFTSRKIISVGRIEEFKSYNFYMINVMEKLIRKFPDIEYHIYGFGSAEKRLINDINKSLAKKNIHFHGTLKYRNFPRVLNSAFCFIGSGSSLLEAAYLGVPSIVSVTFEKGPKTPGFIYDIPLFETGDMENVKSAHKVEKVISKMLSGTKDEYYNICTRCHEHVKHLYIDEVMTDFIRNAKECKQKSIAHDKPKIFNFLSFLLKEKIRQVGSTKYLSR